MDKPISPLEFKQAKIIDSMSKFILLFEHGLNTLKTELREISMGKEPGKLAKDAIESELKQKGFEQ